MKKIFSIDKLNLTFNKKQTLTNFLFFAAQKKSVKNFKPLIWLSPLQ